MRTSMLRWLVCGALALASCTYSTPGNIVCDDGLTDGTRVCVNGFWVESESDMEIDTCVPTSCQEAGAQCGKLANGCGQTLACGDCPLGQECGTETDNICGDVCTPKTCESLGAFCGEIDPGCNQDLVMCAGICADPETCGAVTPNQCGCVPDSCQGVMAECGTPPDGCGQTLDCGTECPDVQTCGGGGVEFECGCTPEETCATQNLACGRFTDDCGREIDCDAGCFVSVSAGENHTCGVTAGGAVLCWGDNTDGRLGDGTRVSRDKPTQVEGLTTGWVSVSVGNSHSCALSTNGDVKCWGNNRKAQLAMDIATVRSLVPVDIAVTGVTVLASGGESVCVVEGQNVIKCWGDNTFSQITGTASPVTTPTVATIAGAVAVTHLAVGRTHSCAIADAKAWCWGLNSAGQIGTGNAAPTIEQPNRVSGVLSYIDIAVGLAHTIAATNNGDVTFWGASHYDMSNNPTGANRSAIPKPGADNTIALSSNFTSSVSATATGAQAWGRNDKGQLGDSSKTDSEIPVSVMVAGAEIKKVSVGQQHACYIDSESELYCWGRNDDNQLGLANAGAEVLIPTKIFR